MRIEFPIINLPAVIGNYGVAVIDIALMVEEFELSFIIFTHRVDVLHEMQNIILLVFE